jgi:protein TonB
VRDPFERVLHFGERKGPLVLALVLGGSMLIHSGLALGAYVRSLRMDPERATCRAGENIQIDAYARSVWGSWLKVSGSAAWQVDDANIASHAGAGFVRCIAQGTTTVRSTYSNASSSLTLEVLPPIVMIDQPEPPEPPPPPEPDPEPVAEVPQPQAPVPQDTKPTAEPPPPAAAKAGQLLASDEPAGADDPVAFPSDPNGQEYGSGVVGKGGTADVGGLGAKVGGVPGGTGTGVPNPGPVAAAPAVAAADLSRKPALRPGDDCGRVFPSDADDDHAVVTVRVTVDPSGAVKNAAVMEENPRGQGFGAAARSCLRAKTLVPALGRDGKPVEATQVFRVNFDRR